MHYTALHPLEDANERSAGGQPEPWVRRRRRRGRQWFSGLQPSTARALALPLAGKTPCWRAGAAGGGPAKSGDITVDQNTLFKPELLG